VFIGGPLAVIWVSCPHRRRSQVCFRATPEFPFDNAFAEITFRVILCRWAGLRDSVNLSLN
jgi:hypothetical protein